MADEAKRTRRQHIADDHPELPGEVVDGLAELAQINAETGIEQDVDVMPGTAEEAADGRPPAAEEPDGH